MARLPGLAFIAVVLASAAAAVGRPSGEATTTTLYFLTADRQAPQQVRRALPPSSADVLRALFAGPTAGEARAGVRTAIPRNALLGFRVEAGGEAVVELSGLASMDDGVERVRVITQIARTLLGLSGIEGVRLRNDGEPWGLWLLSGGVADYLWDNTDLDDLIVGAPVPGTEAVPGDHFTAVP